MKTKIIEEGVYETKKVLTGSKESTLYIANDGKEFKDGKECEHYENTLLAIEQGKDQFVNLNLEWEVMDALSKMIFSGYDVSSSSFFIWIATKDKEKIERATYYLQAKNCGKAYTTLLFNESFNEGDKILISDWVESESSDYPSYKTEAKKVVDVLKEIDNLSNKIKTAITI